MKKLDVKDENEDGISESEIGTRTDFMRIGIELELIPSSKTKSSPIGKFIFGNNLWFILENKKKREGENVIENREENKEKKKNPRMDSYQASGPITRILFSMYTKRLELKTSLNRKWSSFAFVRRTITPF